MLDTNYVSPYADFRLSTGEATIRRYHCTKLRFPRCDGFITVTNKRVVFTGYGGNYSFRSSAPNVELDEGHDGNNRIYEEIAIPNVAGVSSYYGTKTRLIVLYLALALGVVGFLMLANYYTANYVMNRYFFIILGLTLMVSALYLAKMGLRRIFYFKIYSTTGHAPINIGEGNGAGPNSPGYYATIGYPTEETAQMLVEIGALITDIKETGNLAFNKWYVADQEANSQAIGWEHQESIYRGAILEAMKKAKAEKEGG